MDSGGEDACKKRECAQVEDAKAQQRPNKKSQTTRNLRIVLPRPTSTMEDGTTGSAPATRTTPVQASAASASSSTSNNMETVWDLETALQYLVQVESSSQEFITKDNTWITFRVGHAGDASTIAQWYKQSQQQASPEQLVALAQNSEDDTGGVTESSSMLEVWLADGMGDEDTPPSVFALMAHTCHNTSTQQTSTLAAVAVFTLSFEEGDRVLRVEWLHVDPNLEPATVGLPVERRLWLRLSTLCLMTACQLVVKEEWTLRSAAAISASSTRLAPSAE
jgi:hypothetical protein